MGHPTVYPTGATIYNPQKAWSGYTLFQVGGLGALLIDMSGKEVQLWKGLHGFPNKLLPGGNVLGSTGERKAEYGYQDMTDLVQVDWDGNIVWKFNRHELIQDPDQPPQWMARQHHDYQREGSPVGYYSPEATPLVDRGNTLLLTHADVANTDISDKVLVDDRIIEVTWDGEIVWEWNVNEHFDEFGFDEAAKNIIYRDPNIVRTGKGDWMHINSMSTLGQNKHYDGGDERFHPDNIIWDSRESNILAIISKETGKIVWKLGPLYNTSDALKKLGWIIGQHHVHMIPRGLPGEGNILLFDNGGWAGYGLPNPNSPTGRQNAKRDYSRVLELDPISLEIVWQYTPKEAGFVEPLDSSRFYSPFISGAQRLENGNTLITEGSNGRIFEVTEKHEIVWEYINPYIEVEQEQGTVYNGRLNMVYRAYRYPYDWVPQVDKPAETGIEKIIPKHFRVPGAADIGAAKVTEVAGVGGYESKDNFCVVTFEAV
ncbi:aryl-sulfate sulfotransferase [Parasporobacterium paucivorans]|uniref:Arylsulfotransferase (ASST) n=1 Tax=Parasporobacterium paucivorans DSM 15970 TaxID=1122934 RepID=A0A1M6E0R6_9FIRM|nr:aryl-sulfate sulfotransferase [Parasporobacterium paucivorans]SHI78960.1 Arylsulfotransferase (ASST) [Parasporobacterium paucivorans DSM 15970]